MTETLAIHICQDYQVDTDYVFVQIESPECWDIMPISEAKEKGLHIIKCGYCGNPAVRLDHFWPWGSAGNLCQVHRDIPKGGWAKVSGGYYHHFRGYHSLCWRWEIEGYTFGEQPTNSDKQCATCAKKLARANKRGD